MAGELSLQIEAFLLSFLARNHTFFKPEPRLSLVIYVWNVAFEERAVKEEEERGCPDAVQDFVLQQAGRVEWSLSTLGSAALNVRKCQDSHYRAMVSKFGACHESYLSHRQQLHSP